MFKKYIQSAVVRCRPICMLGYTECAILINTGFKECPFNFKVFKCISTCNIGFKICPFIHNNGLNECPFKGNAGANRCLPYVTLLEINSPCL